MSNKTPMTRSETLEVARSARHIPDGHQSLRGSIILDSASAEAYNSQTPVQRGTTYLIGQRVEKDGNLVLHQILSTICKKHQTSWFDSTIFVSTEYGEYQGTDHPTVLLAAIKDAIAALNTRESPLIVDEDDYL